METAPRNSFPRAGVSSPLPSFTAVQLQLSITLPVGGPVGQRSLKMMRLMPQHAMRVAICSGRREEGLSFSRRPATGVKSCPGAKSQKRVSGGVTGGVFFEGSWKTPQKESKKSLQETLRVKDHLIFDSGDSFLTLFRGSARTPQTRLPR